MFVLIPVIVVVLATFAAFFFFRPRIEAAYGMPISALPEETRDILLSIVIVLLTALFFAGILIAFFVYKSITEPLQRLGTATRKITDGDYNFEIKEEGPEELQELCRDFEDMRVRLKDAGEAKIVYDQESKELISNISHDLRTPISSIKGYVEGIMDGVADTPEKMDHYLRTIYNKANEMDTLISELTFYSRIDTNRVPYNFAPVNVRKFFDDAAEDIELELGGQNVEFTYENKVKEDVRIIADAEQIRRAMNNIISNSLKYMDKEEKKMSLFVDEIGDFVKVRVWDNGSGIPKQDIANIFNRFYRADSSRRSKGGSGIGLSIVKKIMEDHGGRAYATSVEGESTTMYLEFRKYVEAKHDEFEEEAAKPQAKRNRRSVHGQSRHNQKRRVQ